MLILIQHIRQVKMGLIVKKRILPKNSECHSFNVFEI